jgi:chemotaxis protein methyltransferase CheR
MFESENKTKLSDQEYSEIAEFIRNYCGINYDNNSKFILEKRLLPRLEFLHLSSFKEYLFYIKYAPNREEELNTIADILTTNETYFFREDYQLKAFKEEILPELKSRKSKEYKNEIRIWSAGCSTGEEPYTLSMLILESGLLNEMHIEIFASDISQRVLQIARKGIYSKPSFRATEEIYIKKYFEQVDGKFRIKDDVKRLVNFGHLNLLDSSRIKLLKPMDVIFCRNVIIYFDNESKKKVIDNFYDSLNEGGYLLLGHAESLMNVSARFQLCHLKNDLVYQKPFKMGNP